MQHPIAYFRARPNQSHTHPQHRAPLRTHPSGHPSRPRTLSHVGTFTGVIFTASPPPLRHTSATPAMPTQSGHIPLPRVHSSQAPPLQHRCFPCPGLLRLLIRTVLPLGMGWKKDPASTRSPQALVKALVSWPDVQRDVTVAVGTRWAARNPHLGAAVQHHGQRRLRPSGSTAASPCPPGRPCRSVASVRLPWRTQSTQTPNTGGQGPGKRWVTKGLC